MKTLTPVAQATPAFARALFTRGTDFIGREEIEQIFGDRLDAVNIPPIPFTEDELTRARKLDQFLVLRTPVTMQQMHDQFDNKLGEGKQLYKVDWYPEELFYTTETTGFEWALRCRKVISNSTSANYLTQTRAIATYLREQVYEGMEMPAAYDDAIKELDEHEEELGELVKKDWQKGAVELADLKLNQLFRGTPADALYDLTVYHKVNGVYLLPNMYHWTKSRSSRGRLVYLGGAGSGGVGVSGGSPGDSNSPLGVWFSRSGVSNSKP